MQEAESYRRVFIRTLNERHAYGGSRTGDWGYKEDQEFFNSIADFQYAEPPFLFPCQAADTFLAPIASLDRNTRNRTGESRT